MIRLAMRRANTAVWRGRVLHRCNCQPRHGTVKSSPLNKQCNILNLLVLLHPLSAAPGQAGDVA